MIGIVGTLNVLSVHFPPSLVMILLHVSLGGISDYVQWHNYNKLILLCMIWTHSCDIYHLSIICLYTLLNYLQYVMPRLASYCYGWAIVSIRLQALLLYIIMESN